MEQTEFDIQFKKALIEQLKKLNNNLSQLVEHTSTIAYVLRDGIVTVEQRKDSIGG